MDLSLDKSIDSTNSLMTVSKIAKNRWPGRIQTRLDLEKRLCYLECDPREIQDVCDWLFTESGYVFAMLVVEETPSQWLLRYIFYSDTEVRQTHSRDSGQVHVLIRLDKPRLTVPSISAHVYAADWHEREAEDLFGLEFEGHPRLGDFVLHNDEWQEDVNPMRKDFDAKKSYTHGEPEPDWHPISIVQAPGSFLMPIGPIYSGAAESTHFLLETVGEDVIRVIPRPFYKYRGIEKITEGQSVESVLLLAERFSGTSAFAHSLAFCQAVEEICGIAVSERAKALRIILAELERLRHHVGAIREICNSTGLAVATSQAAILEEQLLRLSCNFTGHRYLFGLNLPGGLSLDFSNEACREIAQSTKALMERLHELEGMLRFSSSFLDRLEEVGIISYKNALNYCLVGPVARASGIVRDLRKSQPYSGYDAVKFSVPFEQEGDGYARLRILFAELEQSVSILNQVAATLPSGSAIPQTFEVIPGTALGCVETPRGAAFHWLSIGGGGFVVRYRLTTPSFTNWHGFRLAAESFAFQDFPIIMASLGLSVAECDR
jgi:Ni,Fe-hydrogenase III large subunit/Ni,Fe-hydrogenase III component G